MHKPANDPIFTFIEKKRGEGKSGKLAMVAGLNKFLRSDTSYPIGQCCVDIEHGRGGARTPGLLVRRLSHAQIGAVSAPICAFCHRLLGGFSVVSVQPCPLFSDSGSKLGQAQSSRIPLTSKVELIYD